MLNNSRTSSLIASIVEYAVQNMNAAVEILTQQKDEFDDDDDFYKEVNENTSILLDEFVLGLATSEPYLPDVLDALMEKGYEIGEHEDSNHSRDETILEDLVTRFGKKRLIAMIIDL
jgi:uncharacterized protein YebE (UPF0316 family)